jgi:hypothetical protein
VSTGDWRIEEGPGCGGCSYEDGHIFCRKPNCSGRWSIYDEGSPKIEANYYGLATHGFETRAQAEQFLKDPKKWQEALGAEDRLLVDSAFCWPRSAGTLDRLRRNWRSGSAGVWRGRRAP